MKTIDFKQALDKKNENNAPEALFKAAEGKLSDVIVMGITKENDLYFTSTLTDKAKLILILEQFKFELLAGVYDDGEDEYDY